MHIFRWCDCYAPLIGRLLIGGVFIFSGIQKALGLGMIAGYISSVGLPFPMLLATLAMIVELAAGLGLILGFFTRYSAIALAVFVIFATAFFHTDFSSQVQMGFFTKNLMILGGLLYISTYGAGPYALDSGRKGKR